MQTLRLYLDVARHRSFSRAAALHGITQSAVSQRISQLEKRLGLTLLDRSVRPLELTEAGQVYLVGCEELLERYDRLEQKVSGMHDAPAGVVRVAAIYSAGIALLNQLRERFEAEHPRITVQIGYDQPDDVHEAVRSQACELGILSYPQRWRNVSVIPLRDETMVVVCQPSHPLARRERVQAGELTPHEMIGFNRELPVARRIQQYLKQNEASPRVAALFDNVDTIKSALAVTERFSLLPRRTVAREIAAGTLAAVPLEPVLLRPIGIIHRRGDRHGSTLSPAAQAFVDYLLRHAGPEGELPDRAESDKPTLATAVP